MYLWLIGRANNCQPGKNDMSEKSRIVEIAAVVVMAISTTICALTSSLTYVAPRVPAKAEVPSIQNPGTTFFDERDRNEAIIREANHFADARPRVQIPVSIRLP